MKKDNDYNKIIYSGVYNLISIFLVTLFFISIANTSNNKYINNIASENTLNVGSFITDTTAEVSDEK